MERSTAQKNGTRFVVLNGGTMHPRRQRAGRTWYAVEVEVEEPMRRWCDAVRTPEGTRPSRGWQEVAEGRQSFWRIWVRRSREAVAKGVPEHVLTAPTLWFLAWQRSLYQRIPQQQQQRQHAA